MASVLKSIIRKALRFYISYTPIKKGRYPLMITIHKYLKSPELVTVKTKDRGLMTVNLEDLMQYPIYYNLFEAKYLPVMSSLLTNCNVTMDVGGNIGQYALYFALRSNKVYTFEPMPVMIDRLRHHIKINNLENKVFLVTKALSNNNGSIHFALPKSENSGTASTVLGADVNSDDTIEVEAIRLDDFVKQEQLGGKIDLIKMDIEGAELFALQGMSELLSHPKKPILVLEMNDMMTQLAGYRNEDINEYLKMFGYNAYEITKKGLAGPQAKILSNSENYCFLSNEHLMLPHIRALMHA